MSNKNSDYTESWLVRLWVFLLRTAEKVSVFYVLRKCMLKEGASNEKKRLFVDIWLAFNTVLALVFVLIGYMDTVNIIVKYGFIIYGSLRIFEILIYQLNVMLVHPYNAPEYTLNSYRRMTIALIHNFFEIIFWFAGTYLTFHFMENINPGDAIYRSFTHMVTYNLTIESNKWSILALVVLQSQALLGVFMTVISFARFISLFPQPKSMNNSEQQGEKNSNEVIVVKESKEMSDIKKELEEIKKLLQKNSEI